MDTNFELYKVFYYVAKNLSFSEASSDLGITQSAVSQSIKALEDKLSCRLFHRNARAVRLTVEGEGLYKYIEQAFNLIATGERSLQEMLSLKHGEIRIGASDTITKYHLLPYFQQFNHLYPDIKIKVTNRTSPVCLDLLRKGAVDIAVVNIPKEESELGKNLAVTPLHTIHDSFIAGPSHHKLANRKVTLAELANYPLLLLEKNSVTRNYFEALLQQKGIKLTPEIELGSIDLLIDMTKIGLGITFVAREYAQKELAAGEVFVIDTDVPIPGRLLGAVTSSSTPLTAAAQKFLEMLTTTVSK